jgi:hypothetical protein
MVFLYQKMIAKISLVNRAVGHAARSEGGTFENPPPDLSTKIYRNEDLYDF